MLDCKIKETNTDTISLWDIVTSPYVDIYGVKRTGLFLVIYTESNDPNDFNNRNITGLKLTSKNLYANRYRTLVTKDRVPALTNNSYIYANKLSTLLVKHCKFIAKLPADLCEEVLNNLNVYLSQVQTQTSSELINKLKGGE